MPLGSRLSLRASWPFAKVPVFVDEPPPPSTVRVPYLPPEIIETIVIHVADKGTLKSCSLVSTTFLAPAQRLLFANVTICCKVEGVNPFTTFLDLITHKSKNLTILISSLNLFDFTCGSTSWFSQDNHVVPRIMAAMPNLIHLGLHSESRVVSPRIQNALIDVYGRCELTGLSLRGIAVDLTEILRRCLLLKEISLADIELVLSEEDNPIPEPPLDTRDANVPAFCTTPVRRNTPTQSTTVFHLQANIAQFTLQLTRSMPPGIVKSLLDYTIWASFARSLRVLELDLIHFRDGRALQLLLDATSYSVHELRICTFDIESLGFHIPPNITNVVFRFKIVPGLNKDNPSFVDIFQPFNRLHRHSHISEGISDVRLQIDTWTAHSLFDRPLWEWAFLDELLLCVLREVWIIVALVTPGEIMEEMKEALADRVSECLPRAKQKHILKIMVIG